MTHSPCRGCPALAPVSYLWRWWRWSWAGPIHGSAPLVVMFWLLDALLGLGDCGRVGRGSPTGCVGCGRWWKCYGLLALDRPRMLGCRLLCRYTRGILFHLVSLYHRARRLVVCLRWRNSSRHLLLRHSPLLLIPPRVLCLVSLRVYRGCTSLINWGVSGRRRGRTGGVSGLVQGPVVGSRGGRRVVGVVEVLVGTLWATGTILWRWAHDRCCWGKVPWVLSVARKARRRC